MSVSADVLTATVATITAIGLTPTPLIRTRKRLALLDGETPPLVVIAQGDGEQVEQLCTRGGKRRFLVRYPVSVGLVFKSQGKTGANATLRTWREQVRAAMLDWMTGLRANGLPAVNNVEAEGRPVFDATGFEKQGLDWGEMVFAVETVETAR